MKHSELEHLLKLAQKTGDRLIVTDTEGGQPIVILTLAQYEALLLGAPTAKSEPQASTRDYSHAPDEESVDLDKIEAAVAAVQREYTEEPKVVPVKGQEEEVATLPATDRGRQTIVRKQPIPEPSEEQFYLEAV